MGKRRGSRPLTICRFVCFKDKQKTLQNAKKLKNTGTYNLLFSITEVLSYCRVVLEQNQILNLKILKLLKYNIAHNTPDIYLDNSCDLDVNVFNVNFHNSPNCFSIPHLNVTSIKKTSQISNYFTTSINFTLSVICFSETWLYDQRQVEMPHMSHQITKVNTKYGAIV